ncbi:MAG: extracellular solute-binding protein [Alphaproteobacteria bacterium]|nr:extracellular solute-binding protein [Alphaproteobacteria bacterium]
MRQGIRPRLFRLFASALLAGATAAGALADQPVNGLGIAMHGAPKYRDDFKHFDYVNPSAPKGGEVKLAAIGGFDTLNGFVIKGRAAAGLGQIYDSLMAASADEPFSQYGQLAEKIETPADRSWVAFTLRANARWHDGKPITVDDVIFTFNILREKGAPFYRLYYQHVDQVAKTGERTVKFGFKPGENRELPLILGQLPVLPKHYWETRDFAKTTLEPPLGSAAYKIESIDPGRAITYRRVADYWGKDLAVNVGRENFEVIRYDYYRDATVALEAFKAGGFDFRVENSAKEWATGYDVPAVKSGVIVKEALKNSRTQGMQGFAFNVRRPIFQDRKVREALTYAFDFEWSNKTLFYDQYTRSRSYFGNSELEAKGLPEPEELKLLEPLRGQIPDEVFTQEYNPPRTDGSGNIRANLMKGAQLLKQAGWSIKGGKLVNDKTGEPMRFEFLLNNPQFERIVLPFAKNLERLGIEVSVRTVDTAQYQRRSDEFDFDMTVEIWGQSESPGNEQRDFWSTAAADQKGSRNSVGIKSKAIDELIEKLIAAPDRQALVARTRALDRVLQWGFWVIPNFHTNVDRLAYWDKFGRPEVTPKQGAQFDAWWVDPKKDATLAQRKAAAN